MRAAALPSLRQRLGVKADIVYSAYFNPTRIVQQHCPEFMKLSYLESWIGTYHPDLFYDLKIHLAPSNMSKHGPCVPYRSNRAASAARIAPSSFQLPKNKLGVILRRLHFHRLRNGGRLIDTVSGHLLHNWSVPIVALIQQMREWIIKAWQDAKSKCKPNAFNGLFRIK